VDSAGAQGNSGASSLRLGHWAVGRLRLGCHQPGGRDTNAATDIFVHDLKTGQTVRVAVDSAGAKATTVASSRNLGHRAGGGIIDSFVSATRWGHTNRMADHTRPWPRLRGRSYCCCLGPG